MLEKGKFTFAMIKPVAVERGDIGSIIQIIEDKGFRIAAMKKTVFSSEFAQEIYAEHNAVLDYRKIIGATNPEEAAEGTIRKLFAETLRKNAVHGSDADHSAFREVNIVFNAKEIY